jgi:glycosyltransferase
LRFNKIPFDEPNIKVKYIPKVFYKMRVGGESNKSLSNIIKKSKEDLKALKKNRIGGLSTLFYKNFSKIIQFIKK